jgi:transcriptional regulator with XRE-family HTH domain
LSEFPECFTVGAVEEPPPTPWPESLTAEIGRRVARFRRERKLTAQQLSDVLRDRLGIDMKRSVIGSLEAGMRKTVSVSEVFAIAYVLAVPPLLLIAPLGEAHDVEVLPGVSVDPWAIVRWAAGEGALRQLDVAPEQEAQVGLLRLYRWHDQSIREWDVARHVTVGAGAADEQFALARLRGITNDITMARRLIRQVDAEPPPLPPQLQYLDERKAGPDA